MIGLILSVIFFIVITELLFYKTKSAPFIYCFIGLSALLPLNNTDRNDFLFTVFQKADWYKIRFIENLMIILPFTVYLIIKSHIALALILVILSIFLSLIKSMYISRFTLATPFGKQPFEFAIGFRKTFLLILFYYFLSTMAIVYENFNLGIFSLIITMLTTLSFYSQIEPDHYLSIYNLDPKAFLFHKISIGVKQLLVLVMPMFLVVVFTFPNQLLVLILFGVLGIGCITMMILAKYNAYPKQIDLLVALLITFSMAIPFIMIFTIPYLYKKSVNNLQLQ